MITPKKKDPLLQEIFELADSFSRDITNGKNVNLALFEEKMVEFCSSIAKLSKEEAKEYQNDLDDIRNLLDRWSEYFLSKQNEIAEKIDEHSQMSVATSAYRKTSNYFIGNNETDE